MKQKKMRLILVFMSLFVGLFHQTHAASDANLQDEILHYINQYRIKHHLSQLKTNDLITLEATKHSQEMAQHQIPFGHQKFQQRMARLMKQIDNARGGAENVAFNYKTAKIVVNGWLNSPGHRHNIRGNYNLTGIGIARDKQGRIYYTQLFLRAKSSLIS
jgi:uncharacterized protein YkwD